MGEVDQTVVCVASSLQESSKFGLIAYATLMLIPIFNNNAGIHQWNIQVIDLIRWTKVNHMLPTDLHMVSKLRSC